jgi:hypothetical protein
MTFYRIADLSIDEFHKNPDENPPKMGPGTYNTPRD